MHTPRRTVAVLIALAMVGYGFVPTVHVAITEKALWNLQSEWSPPDALRAALGKRWFTEDSIKEIGDANTAADQGDCTPAKADLPTEPCGTPQGVYDLKQDATFPGDHFDNELIEASNNQLKRVRLEILARLRERRYIAARKQLGKALHALQDFYSHTNWVEMGQREIEGRLAKSSFGTGFPPVAGPTERTCTDPSTPYRFPPAPQQRLTSGFYPNEHPAIDKYGKCAHGDVLKTSNWKRGISKDLHARDIKVPAVPVLLLIVLESKWDEYRYEMARALSYDHTKLFVREILDDPALQASPDMILGLMGHEQSTCKCPDPVAEHQDKPGWIDVSGTKLNESDVIVKAGDTVEFQGTGLVMWGLEYGFFGRELFTGPAGTVDPGVRINVTPPLPRFPIGLLYAAIFDEKEIRGTLKDGTGVPVAAGGYQIKPLTTVPIGAGTRMQMTEGGRLFFGVNDGNLSNNRGCFQVKVTIEWRK